MPQDNGNWNKMPNLFEAPQPAQSRAAARDTAQEASQGQQGQPQLAASQPVGESAPEAQAQPQVTAQVQPQPQSMRQEQLQAAQLQADEQGAAQSAPLGQPQQTPQTQQVPQPQRLQQDQQPQQAQGAPQGQPYWGQAPQAPASAYQQPYAYQVAAPAAPAAYQALAQKKSRGWIIALVVIVCLFAFCAFCVKTCSDMFVSTAGYGSVAQGTVGDTVAVIDLDGTIQYDGSACSPEGFKELLDEASDDPNIKALVLRVNSGGGTATAGEEMATYLRDFDKPVVVSSASINASAAYEISSQADYIYVAKSTEIGAIGTAMEVTDLSGLLDMLGVNMDVITSAESKDSSYGYRPLTDDERAYYQHMVDQINDTFVENVATGRSMSMEEAQALATGLPFTGVDAVENGIADAVGTLEDAADKAAELAGISDYDLYDLGFSSYDLASLYDLFGYSNDQSQRLSPQSTPIARQ